MLGQELLGLLNQIQPRLLAVPAAGRDRQRCVSGAAERQSDMANLPAGYSAPPSSPTSSLAGCGRQHRSQRRPRGRRTWRPWPHRRLTGLEGSRAGRRGRAACSPGRQTSRRRRQRCHSTAGAPVRGGRGGNAAGCVYKAWAVATRQAKVRQGRAGVKPGRLQEQLVE